MLCIHLNQFFGEGVRVLGLLCRTRSYIKVFLSGVVRRRHQLGHAEEVVSLLLVDTFRLHLDL